MIEHERARDVAGRGRAPTVAEIQIPPGLRYGFLERVLAVLSGVPGLLGLRRAALGRTIALELEAAYRDGVLAGRREASERTRG